MRLLQVRDDGEFSLSEFGEKDTPSYTILSHTWGADCEEVNFKDLSDGNKDTDKKGYCKLRFCGNQAAKDDLRFF
jgi:hypothetical protein